jgi:maltose alpha-D-glucosyltransferase/alpha-amylase
MRANIGIRRRLSSLLDNSRAEVELIHALLLSMPGSPCLYYGDEIGMGDNIWLADRDAVRTPMQWTPDRNAGFSTADPGKLYLPVVQSLVYNYAITNVEAQIASSSSLLHWVRSMLSIRRQNPVFGMGAYVPVRTDNDAVLAFLRRLDSEHDSDEGGASVVLCVNNLARTPQTARLSLPDSIAGHLTRDLFGGATFPTIPDSGPLALTMGSRDFYWLDVRAGESSR